ncbi:MAG: TIGR04282 family arsenosugar biosynthesis glycosyltransferase [Bacillota bacterium]
MRLIIFTRYPEAGIVKTRLIPALGPEGAQLLHREMTEYTIRQARRVDCDLEVRYSGGSRELMAEWLGEGLSYRKQEGDTLGERMQDAAAKAFSAGSNKVAMIGTDCPGLTAEQIKKAFGLLDQADLVLGPAFDGGYYLIGMRRPHDILFRDIPWGSEFVLKVTLETAEKLKLKTALLEKLTDIDCPEDLLKWP